MNNDYAAVFNRTCTHSSIKKKANSYKRNHLEETDSDSCLVDIDLRSVLDSSVNTWECRFSFQVALGLTGACVRVLVFRQLPIRNLEN